MSGRVLFAFVWLIIAAGLVLPLYPRDVVTSSVTATGDPVQLVAASAPFDCEECPIDDAGDASCRSDCPCGDTLPVVFVPLEQPFSLTIAVRPAKLPAKLPAI